MMCARFVALGKRRVPGARASVVMFDGEYGVVYRLKHDSTESCVLRCTSGCGLTGLDISVSIICSASARSFESVGVRYGVIARLIPMRRVS